MATWAVHHRLSVATESSRRQRYIRFSPNPAGFAEDRHGLEFLAQTNPRWISVFTLHDRFSIDEAVSPGSDDLRAYEALIDSECYPAAAIQAAERNVAVTPEDC
jgi:hypothetical protein